MKTKLKLMLFALVLFFSYESIGQSLKTINANIQETSPLNALSGLTPQIQASYFKLYKIDEEAIFGQLEGIAHKETPNDGFQAIITLPHPDGTLHQYKSIENTTMSRGYSEVFPEIISLDAVGVDNPAAVVKWDITPHGLHAMIMIPGESTIYIDPYIKGNNEYYIVYDRNGYISSQSMDCGFVSDNEALETENTNGTVKSYGTCELRTYRMALAATGEYTIFHGGTVVLAAAAQVTTMNRVNGVYERDMAITMTIIPNNNLIIYTSTTTDPFTNGNPGTMIGQNQTTCDGVIGSANYDIGHVFGTNSGGLAGLGVVCTNSQKARGVTGSGAPIGDLFDIDYVAHEVGHQFGANHSFNNSCGGNRNDNTAVEPGSGNTIMGYAGICAPNTQNFSDDHFSGRNLQEIDVEILSAGHTCEALSGLGNNAPIILTTNANITVPINTPFALTASATDADGNTLTYNWEQMDNQISTQPPVATATGGPNFISKPSSTNPTRYFPSLESLATNGPYTWEVVPSVSRTMNFRLIVRDNAGGGGCNDHENVTLATTATAGPFVVQYPSNTGITWNALTSETVTWSVANTDVAPVNCTNVNIYLSIDGGQTYPHVLATNTPNDGSELISVPNLGTTQARVMVISANGSFFDISNNNFTIVQATNDYTLSATPTSISVCQPADAVYTINVGSVGGYSDNVGLTLSNVPAGATTNFSSSNVIPGNSSTLTISNTGNIIPGTYVITVNGNSTTGPKTTTITLIVGDDAPSATTLTAPANGATNVLFPINLTWTTIADPTAVYTIQIATDAGFTSIVDQATGLTAATYSMSTGLPNQTYYWRVSYETSCGTAPFSSVFNFTTNGCTTYSSTDGPIAISATGTPTITSTINVPTGGTINDVNVVNLLGTHTWIKNLTVSLTSPLGTTVVLFDQICNNQDNFNVGFDDAAASATLPCPPTDGNAYQSVGLLSAFNGEDAQGNWVLTIVDNLNNNGGSLTSWQLELCVDPSVGCSNPDVPTISGTTTICEGETTTLAINTGNLNDATNWNWYTASCGGTFVQAGTSIDVTPIVGTTTYYVRGEGGCVTPGTCAEITVTTNPVFATTDAETICQGQTYVFGTQSLTIAGVYVETFSSVNGCDSTVTLTLDVLTEFIESATASICQGDSYVFGTQTLTTGGSYSELFTSVSGCDSTVNLTLTVNPTYNETASATICQGDSYVFGTQTLTTAGTFNETFSSVNGCDSTVSLTLTVNPTFNTTSSATICQGDSFVFGTQTLTTAGTFNETFTSANGCDSTVSLTLTVNPTFNTTSSAAICQGDSYVFGTQTLTTAGTFNETFSSANGCDSTVSLTLSVIAPYNETASASICQGDSYVFGTQTLTTAGTFNETFSSINGCDSTVNLTLTVHPNYTENTTATICQGDSYVFGTQTLTTGGVYVESFSTINGCDSTVSLTLTVNPIFNTTSSATICEGDTYVFGSQTLTNAGTYNETYSSEDGCDSTVTLTLNVTTINTSVANNNGVLSASQNGASYQWVDCDNGNAEIEGETNQSYSPSGTYGNYAVQITIDGCMEQSECLLHDETGLETIHSELFSIYPNPGSDNVTVSWEGIDFTKIVITDVNGKILNSIATTGMTSVEIEINNFASGVYFVQAFSTNEVIVNKLIKE